jgi:formylglycine-generating enzyme required for sulfatase activity
VAYLVREQIVEMPAFAIDRTEVTNAAFAIFTEMAEVHEIVASEYPDELAVASGPSYPRAEIDWFDARAYCRFLGKDLPTSLQWQKALRGGLALLEGPNPAPRRNLPWVASHRPAWELARIAADAQLPDAGAQFGVAGDPRRPAPVGSYLEDRSPYGVLDLAGNVQEWTLDPEPDTEHKHLPPLLQTRITRGGNWFDTPAATLDDYMAAQNNRSPRWRQPTGGVRCALQVRAAGAHRGN